MDAAVRLALCIPLLAGPALAACAGGTPAPPPESAQPPRDDGRAQLVRTLERLKQPGANAEKDTEAARSVLEAIGGSPQMQGDAGLADH